MTYQENNKSLIYQDALWDIATLRFDIESFRFMSMRLIPFVMDIRRIHPLYMVILSDIGNFDNSRIVKFQHHIMNNYEIKNTHRIWFTLPHEADLSNRA